jgi:NAD(P)-dependent dehydrogenase (short-subunit alcohol dehydrogenase family)
MVYAAAVAYGACP